MTPLQNLQTAAQNFLRLESAGGILLVLAAVMATVLMNSPLSRAYDAFLQVPLSVQFGAIGVAKPLLLWINDGLMAVFFFLVGLELKREFLEGELSTPAQVTLPIVAAMGGMVVPALVYAGFNAGDPVAMNGWAIPAATDIAFALGVLTLLGDRVPPSLKIFLLALAIIDDLGAIVIIAIFYADDLSGGALFAALVCILLLLVLNVSGVMRSAAYYLVGIALWLAVLKSGVHATLAGVVCALFVPLKSPVASAASPLRALEHDLHPWVAYGILPLFAFANAGVDLAGLSFGSVLEPVPLGIAAGLLVGKQVGIFGTVWLMVKLRWARRPEGARWSHLYGVSILCGIGFTMSFFIGSLAFEGRGESYATAVRVGVLCGSLVSAALGYLLLRFVAPRAAPLS